MDVDWVKETECVVKEYFEASDAPFARAMKWKAVLETYNGLGFLEHSFQGGVKNLKGPKDFVLDHYESYSVIAILDAEAMAKARYKFRAVLNKYFNDTDEITIPLKCECY